MTETCTLGLRIFTRIARPAAADQESLRNAGVGDVSDVMRGSGIVDGGIVPCYAPMPRIFGPAITADVSPGDGLIMRAAIDAAQPGDVIVVNAHGVTARAILGGAIGMHMVNRGVVGLIVDGAVRDIEEFRALGLPVMARSVTPRSGTSASGWGEVNVPIACGGAVVHPGDLVVADEEGIAFVPRRWVGIVGASIGKAGHPMYEPGSIRDKLAALGPKAEVLGMDRVRKAVAERNGIIVDETFANHERDA